MLLVLMLHDMPMQIESWEAFPFLRRKGNKRMGEVERRGVWSSDSVCLTSRKLWLQSPVPDKPEMVANACNPSTWEVKAEGSEVQGHPEHSAHSRLESSLTSVRSCLKRTKNTSPHSVDRECPAWHSCAFLPPLLRLLAFIFSCLGGGDLPKPDCKL